MPDPADPADPVKPANQPHRVFAPASGRGYVLAAAGPPVALAVLTAAFTLLADPYLLWHDGPHDGRPAPVSERLCKPLQIIARNPEIVCLGSSRTMMGIDPQALAPRRGYNCGAALESAEEVAAFGRHALRWTDADTFVIGVDYFMADDDTPPYQAGAGPDLGTPRRLVEAGGAVLLSFDALRDAIRGLGLMDGSQRPRFTPDGWYDHHTRLAAEKAATLVAEPLGPPRRFNLSRLEPIDRLLCACEARGVRTLIYIPPVHALQHEGELARSGTEPMARFRVAVRDMAARHGAPFVDFTPPHAISRLPLTAGNPYYQDPGHYTSRVGNLILARLGFAVPSEPTDAALTADFGHPTAARLATRSADETRTR